MGTRDRFTEAVSCPKCEQTGVLHISEDDYPFSPPHRSVDKIDGNFTAEVLHGVRMRLTCGACAEQWET